MPAPTITLVSPSIGPIAGGTGVIITGTGFQFGVGVTIGGVAAINVVLLSATSISLITPPHAVGAVNVVVTNPDTSTVTLTNGFVYETQLVLDYSYETESPPEDPIAIIAPPSQETVVGALVRLDGRASFSPTGVPLSFQWSFKQVPIGSQARATGFKDLELDSSAVSFSPDVTGLYVVELIVNDGSFDSLPATSDINARVVLVPQNQGIVPDVSWVWNFLSDFWTRVDQRSRFETFWSAAVQIIAAEQLKLWQYDYNKSIKDIQDLIQKRWLAFEPEIDLDASQTSFILADDQAGLNARSYLLDPLTNIPQTDPPLYSNLVTVPNTEGSFAKTAYGSPIATGRVLQFGEQGFTLARTGVATQAVLRGVDGMTQHLSDLFHGSVFTMAMEGMILRINSGPLAGTAYKIILFVDTGTLKVQNLDGSAVSFSTGTSGLLYSIYSSTPTLNSFFGDQNTVPTEQGPLPWRFSPTLISTEHDFEAQGVAAGDVLVLRVERQDTKQTTTLNVQIVSVDRGRLGFVLNTVDLTDGAAAPGVSRDDQIKMAQDLQVPGLMISTVDNSLIYTDQALQIITLVQSTVFKRATFETTLSSDSVIDLGPFEVTITPLSVIRNSNILVDSTVKAIPSLQEYVKQPTVIETDTGLFQVAEGKLYALSRKPYTVFENADYVVDNDSGISGTCSLTAGLDTLNVPFGDLLDRAIRQGDTITVTDGASELVFAIVAIVDPDTVRISPPSPKTLAAAPFSITRKTAGTFIRFVKGTFTKSVPAPSRFWAEVVFFDNGQAIEDNFGVLVGVKRQDLLSVGATISYKNAVAGLMYALTNGPTVANLQLASQILLGLPFTTNPGTIIEIDPEFKVNPDGSPLIGRILISAEDDQGVATGVTNIFFYPQGRQVPDLANPGGWVPVSPELSGVAVNPDTGVEYRVGDHVEKFVALSKGTQIQDYLTTASLVQQFLNEGNSPFFVQRYHSFRLVVNSDIISAVDTDLVAQFIREAKPTYTKLALALDKTVEDVVDINDAFFVHIPVLFLDNESLSMPVAATLDAQSVDAGFVSTEGSAWSYRVAGTDLSTTQASLAVTSPSGGFIVPRPGEAHDQPFLLNGYLLVIVSGPNAGRYLVSTVDSDTQITLQSLDTHGLAFNFQTLSGQSFVIYMPVLCKVATGSTPISNGSNTVTVTTHDLASLGVAAGDLLVFWKTAGPVYSRIYKINSVTSSQLGVLPAIQEANGTYTFAVYRSGLITRHFGYQPADVPVRLVFTNTQKSATLDTGSADLSVALLMHPGDTIVNPTTAEEFVVLDFDPSTGTAYFEPAAANSGTYDVALERRARGADTIVSTDILDRVPGESLFLTLRRRSVAAGGVGPDLTTTAASATVSTVSGQNFDTGLGVRPGDFLVVLENADSTRDIGYGAGIFPILEVSGTSLLLSRPLTATNNAPGILFGIQRRRPNER